MKLAISITTYNRPDLLFTQLMRLSKQLRGTDVELFIVNDASQRSYEKPEWLIKNLWFPVDYSIVENNHGKKNHWRIVNRIFTWFRNRQWDYAIYLQDDIVIDDSFISNLIHQFELINYESKTCLNYILEPSRMHTKVWTPVYPVTHTFDGIDFFRTGWVDLHFIANRLFFDTLNWRIRPVSPERWHEDPTLSSGVGKQISWSLYRKRLSMWQVSNSLAKHGIHESLMNPVARKSNPNFESI